MEGADLSKVWHFRETHSPWISQDSPDQCPMPINANHPVRRELYFEVLKTSKSDLIDIGINARILIGIGHWSRQSWSLQSKLEKACYILWKMQHFSRSVRKTAQQVCLIIFTLEKDISWRKTSNSFLWWIFGLHSKNYFPYRKAFFYPGEGLPKFLSFSISSARGRV